MTTSEYQLLYVFGFFLLLGEERGGWRNENWVYVARVGIYLRTFFDMDVSKGSKKSVEHGGKLLQVYTKGPMFR